MKPNLTLSRIDGLPADLPLVSVIIPAYNAEAFLNKAIESALAQTHHPLEIIVVDDGSADSTIEVATTFPVTLVRQSNGGPAGARNAGVLASSGEWLAFLDHDDTWHADKTAVQLTYVDERTSAVFSPKDPAKPTFTFDELFWRNLGGNPSSTLIRRDTLISLGMFDADRALMGLDDYNLWLKFLHAGHSFKITPKLYEFTPAAGHYGGKLDKMLAAELVNIEKISSLACIDDKTVALRKRSLRLEYLPSLIFTRDLDCAREQLKELGFDFVAFRYWHAFLPESIINVKRSLKKGLRIR